MTPPGSVSIVLDLDGVVYLDHLGIPGVKDALEQIELAGHQVLYATNNSGKTAEIVVDQILERTGFAADPAAVVTSSQAAAAYVAARHQSVYVVGSDPLREELRRSGLRLSSARDADAVVVGLDRDLSYASIADAATAIRRGAEFVATNVDPTYPTPAGLAPGAGSIVAAVQTASQTTPIVCGKPTAAFLTLVERRILHPDVWMVGDRLDTDIALADAAGWTSVLTLTGVTAATDLPGSHAPDHIIDSIADLPPLLAESLAPIDGPR